MIARIGTWKELLASAFPIDAQRLRLNWPYTLVEKFGEDDISLSPMPRGVSIVLGPAPYTRDMKGAALGTEVDDLVVVVRFILPGKKLTRRLIVPTVSIGLCDPANDSFVPKRVCVEARNLGKLLLKRTNT